VLDLDLKTVQLSGRVTLNGQALPDLTHARGTLVFTGVQTGTSVAVNLGSNGPFSYAVTLPPGAYDVGYAPDSLACNAPSNTPMPCSGGPLRTAVSLTTDGALDVDIPAVQVSGHVTLSGAALPAQTIDRGSLRFSLTDHGSAAAQWALGSTGDVSYQVTLLPGRYAVGYGANLNACQQLSSSPLPCVAGTVTTANLTQSGTLDVDLPAIHVSGAVTVKGQAMPAVSGKSDRGSLQFTLKDMGTGQSRSFGASGPASYQLTLLPGHYTVQYLAPLAFCDGVTAPPMPCNSGAVRELDLQQSGTLDVDLPYVKVTGQFTLDGAMLPAGSQHPSLSFFSESGSSLSTKPFAGGSPAMYAVSLLPGRYKVRYLSQGTCDGVSLTPLPCNSGMVLEQALSTDGNLDVDLKAVKVTGTVTLLGAPMPAQSVSRGSLTFVGEPGLEQDFAGGPLSSSGPVSYAYALLPGTYAVRFNGNGQLCATSAAPQVPCLGGVLKANVALTQDGSLDLDVPAVKVEGTVTVNGQPLPDGPSNRGELSLQAHGGDALLVPLGSSRPGHYAVTVMPDHYVVEHRANPGLCNGVTAAALPCSSSVLKGCP
jgi:hypothetical protein